MPKKWLIFSVCLLAFWGIYSISLNIVRHSGYYAQHLPHQEGTNPELIFTLKHLYYLEKPDDKSLRYDYDGMNAIIVKGDFILNSHIEPTIISSYSNNGSTPYSYSGSTSYKFDNKGKFKEKVTINQTTDEFQHSKSVKSKEEALAYVERAIRPILDVQPKPEVNLQWLFNLIYQRQFE